MLSIQLLGLTLTIKDNREPTYRRTRFTWNYCFYMINQANTLINGVEASSLSSADKRVNGIWICLARFSIIN
jgi:hypothetical protein